MAGAEQLLSPPHPTEVPVLGDALLQGLAAGLSLRRLRTAGVSRGTSSSSGVEIGDTGISLTGWPLVIVCLIGVACCCTCLVRYLSRRKRSKRSSVSPDDHREGYHDEVQGREGAGDLGATDREFFKAEQDLKRARKHSAPIVTLRMMPDGRVSRDTSGTGSEEMTGSRDPVRVQSTESSRRYARADHPELQRHWEVLGLPEEPTTKEIKAIHRQLVLQHSPENDPSEAAAQRLQEVELAFKAIKGTFARRERV